MEFIVNTYNTIFFEPLLNALVFLINAIPFHDVGLAVILLTLIVRFITFPLNHRAIVTQVKIKELEPELKNIKDKFKKDSQEQARRTMDLYKAHGINPLSGFLTLIIQIPIIIALYGVFRAGANFDLSHLYSFISVPGSLNTIFLGIFDVSEKSYILAFLTGASQFIQMRLALPPIKKSVSDKPSFKEDFARNMNIQMRYIMPIFIIFIASRFAAAIALYWTTMNIFAIIHETIVRKKAKKIITENDGKSSPNSQIINRSNS
ncbi:YidC/Oxa1 family membrane protein insertase [Patescibacteria group bacterium]|nr:YidC/Oxa1 family membrane protein insertase [Patescibacteria group bacterium]